MFQTRAEYFYQDFSGTPSTPSLPQPKAQPAVPATKPPSLQIQEPQIHVTIPKRPFHAIQRDCLDFISRLPHNSGQKGTQNSLQYDPVEAGVVVLNEPKPHTLQPTEAGGKTNVRSPFEWDEVRYQCVKDSLYIPLTNKRQKATVMEESSASKPTRRYDARLSSQHKAQQTDLPQPVYPPAPNITRVSSANRHEAEPITRITKTDNAVEAEPRYLVLPGPELRTSMDENIFRVSFDSIHEMSSDKGGKLSTLPKQIGIVANPPYLSKSWEEKSIQTEESHLKIKPQPQTPGKYQLVHSSGTQTDTFLNTHANVNPAAYGSPHLRGSSRRSDRLESSPRLNTSSRVHDRTLEKENSRASEYSRRSNSVSVKSLSPLKRTDPRIQDILQPSKRNSPRRHESGYLGAVWNNPEHDNGLSICVKVIISNGQQWYAFCTSDGRQSDPLSTISVRSHRVEFVSVLYRTTSDSLLVVVAGTVEAAAGFIVAFQVDIGTETLEQSDEYNEDTLLPPAIQIRGRQLSDSTGLRGILAKQQSKVFEGAKILAREISKSVLGGKSQGFNTPKCFLRQPEGNLIIVGTDRGGVLLILWKEEAPKFKLQSMLSLKFQRPVESLQWYSREELLVTVDGEPDVFRFNIRNPEIFKDTDDALSTFEKKVASLQMEGIQLKRLSTFQADPNPAPNQLDIPRLSFHAIN